MGLIQSVVIKQYESTERSVFNMFCKRKQEKLGCFWKAGDGNATPKLQEILVAGPAEVSVWVCELLRAHCWFGVNDGILRTIQTRNYSRAWNLGQGGKCCWETCSKLLPGSTAAILLSCLPRAVLHGASPRAHAEGPAQRLLPEGHQGGHPQLQ